MLLCNSSRITCNNKAIAIQLPGKMVTRVTEPCMSGLLTIKYKAVLSAVDNVALTAETSYKYIVAIDSATYLPMISSLKIQFTTKRNRNHSPKHNTISMATSFHELIL